MIDQIKRFKYAQPFEPFEIEFSSGSAWKIRASDFVIVDEFAQGRIAVLNGDHTFSSERFARRASRHRESRLKLTANRHELTRRILHFLIQVLDHEILSLPANDRHSNA
jgi:hypothetical protein